MLQRSALPHQLACAGVPCTSMASRVIPRRPASSLLSSRLQPTFRTYLSRATTAGSASLLQQHPHIASPRPAQSSHYATMANIQVLPLPLPPSADASKFTEFGREVKGVDPGNLTPEQFRHIEELLYKVRHPQWDAALSRMGLTALSILPYSSAMRKSRRNSSMRSPRRLTPRLAAMGTETTRLAKRSRLFCTQT